MHKYAFTIGFGIATAVLAVLCFSLMGGWWAMEAEEDKLWNIVRTADPKSDQYKQAQAKLLTMAQPEHFLFYGGIVCGALGVAALVGLLIAGIKEGSTAGGL